MADEQAGSERFDSWRGLLGKRVRVTLEHGIPDGNMPTTIVAGTLLAFDEGGGAVVRDDMGFCHYCWPMLDVTEVPHSAADQQGGE